MVTPAQASVRTCAVRRRKIALLPPCTSLLPHCSQGQPGGAAQQHQPVLLLVQAPPVPPHPLRGARGRQRGGCARRGRRARHRGRRARHEHHGLNAFSVAAPTTLPPATALPSPLVATGSAVPARAPVRQRLRPPPHFAEADACTLPPCLPPASACAHCPHCLLGHMPACRHSSPPLHLCYPVSDFRPWRSLIR